jgi:phosphoribosylformylglycinamidine synthase PurS subunit
MAMKTFWVAVTVRLKPQIRDPQSGLIQEALNKLDQDCEVVGLSQGKLFEFHVTAKDKDAAMDFADKISNSFLCNPQVEVYSVKVEEE